jgi:hypothetical protein
MYCHFIPAQNNNNNNNILKSISKQELLSYAMIVIEYIKEELLELVVTMTMTMTIMMIFIIIKILY